MSLEKTIIKGIISKFLPPWTERVGIPPSRPELAAVFPERTSPIPMDLAPSSSLDGIYIDGEDSPKDSREFAAQMETLGPGGVAIMLLSREHWTLKGLRQACEGTGFRLLFSSAVRSGQKIRYTQEGLPVPASWWRRIFQAGRLSTFPSLSFRRGQAFFVVLQKKFSQSLSGRSGLSVVMLMPEDRNAASTMLLAWDSFLKEKKFDDAQLVYVEDSRLDPPALDLETDAVRKVDHYRPTGPYGALRSGLAFSRGRKVIVDFSRGTVDPSLCMPLLDRFIREEKNLGKRHFAIQGIDYRMRNPYGWLKGLVLRFVAGTVYPDSPLRIYPSWTASLLADLHPEEVKKNPLLLSIAVRRNGGKFINERINAKGVKNALKLSIPSMLFSYLRMRTGKLLGFLFMSVLAFCTIPFLDRGLDHLQGAITGSNLSLTWIVSGTALLMGWNQRMIPNHDLGLSEFHEYARSHVPRWQKKLNGGLRLAGASRFMIAAIVALQIYLVSLVFYVASALVVFRRPGRKGLIISIFAFYLAGLLFLLGSPIYDNLLFQLRDGIWELSRVVQFAWSGEWQKADLLYVYLWQWIPMKLITAFLVIWLFRRKGF